MVKLQIFIFFITKTFFFGKIVDFDFHFMRIYPTKKWKSLISSLQVNVCVKVTSEDSYSDVDLPDGSSIKRSVFQVADGTGAITLSVYGKKHIKQIRGMPLVRLKNVVVHVVDGVMSLSTYDSTSISNVRKTGGEFFFASQ